MGEVTLPSDTIRYAVPSVGCPANGSSWSGVKIRIEYRSPPASVTNVVSLNPISRAIACMPASSRSAGGSGTTQSWLPANGRSQKTSSSRNLTSMAPEYPRARSLATLERPRV